MVKYGTAERAEMAAAAKAELSTWSIKALQQTARACGFSYCSRLNKAGIAERIAMAFVNKALPGRPARPMSAEALANWSAM